MNDIDLNERTAVITGGAQGFGYAVAERLLASGASVCLWDYDDSLLEQAQQQLQKNAPTGQQVSIDRVDVSDHKAVQACADAVVSRLGGIDIAVNNAGIAGPTVPSWEYAVEDWQQVIEIDLNGVYYCCRAIVPYMREKKYGRIVNVASIAGKEGNPNAAAYSAAKAGVIALTKSIAKETADLDIGINCVTPAAAKTRIFDQISQTHIDYMLEKIPRGRFLKVEEMAAMVAWLVSAENSFTTGSAFDLSGGRATY